MQKEALVLLRQAKRGRKWPKLMIEAALTVLWDCRCDSSRKEKCRNLEGRWRHVRVVNIRRWVGRLGGISDRDRLLVLNNNWQGCEGRGRWLGFIKINLWRASWLHIMECSKQNHCPERLLWRVAIQRSIDQQDKCRKWTRKPPTKVSKNPQPCCWR